MPYADPEERRRYLREWKRRNRRRYAERDRAWMGARNHNKRAAEHGALGIITADEAQAIFAAEQCYLCGTTESTPHWTLDHVIPLHDGGINRPENLRCCCLACNISKFRGAEPGRWSRLYDCCRSCGTDEQKHVARGLCNACYLEAAKQGRLDEYPRYWPEKKVEMPK